MCPVESSRDHTGGLSRADVYTTDEPAFDQRGLEPPVDLPPPLLLELLPVDEK